MIDPERFAEAFRAAAERDQGELVMELRCAVHGLLLLPEATTPDPGQPGQLGRFNCSEPECGVKVVVAVKAQPEVGRD